MDVQWWWCSKCHAKVLDSRGKHRMARPFSPVAETPHYWYWCDPCRAANKGGRADKRRREAAQDAEKNTKMGDFFSPKEPRRV